MLKQIKKGIYSLNTPNLNNEEQVIIAVHPYFKIYRRDFDHYKFKPYQLQELSKYEERLVNLLRNHKGPIITFENESSLDKTVNRYELSGRKKDAYFIKTDYDGLRLIEFGSWSDSGWDEVLEFINQFKGKPWGLIGGYYSKKSRYGKCLGGLIRKLEEKREKSFEVLEDLTFSVV